MIHLSSIVLLFPLWFSLTEQAPISLEQIVLHASQELSEQSVQVLQDGYAQLTPAERSRTAYEIRTDSSSRAQKLLLGWLRSEKNLFVQGAILEALEDTNLDTIPENAIRPFLSAPDASLQNYAMRLYGQLPSADFSYLDTLCNDSGNPGFQIALFEALVQRSDTAFENFPIATLLKFKKSPVPQVADAALRAALSAPGSRNSEVEHWQAVASQSEQASTRAAAASDLHVNTDTIALKLAKDPHVSVRLAVYQSYRDGTRDALRHLLGTSPDLDPAVREAKVNLLRRLPQIPDLPEVHSLLLAALADSFSQVREAAEAVLSGENMPRGLAYDITAEALDSSHDTVRLAAYRQISAREFRELLETVRSRIAMEKNSENIVAALNVVITLKPAGDPADLEYFRPYAAHRSPLVRAIAAHAFGKLQVPGSEPDIIQLATKDSNSSVRAHAFEAMGFFPQRVFLPYLEQCFANREGTQDAARARAAACWAAPRIQPATEQDFAIIDQISTNMFILATKPTIPEAMGMLVFDRDFVIANAILAIARLSKLHPDHPIPLAHGKNILELYQKAENGGQQNAFANTVSIPITETLSDVIRQTRQFLGDEECTTAPLKPSRLSITLDYFKPHEE
ncbi:MAG: HEAT repeat domain-containing protein [Victivallales bacterium]|nr:HEAT repeat domain-containing protein [Victivallales bacterium]